MHTPLISTTSLSLLPLSLSLSLRGTQCGWNPECCSCYFAPPATLLYPSPMVFPLSTLLFLYTLWAFLIDFHSYFDICSLPTFKTQIFHVYIQYFALENGIFGRFPDPTSSIVWIQGLFVCHLNPMRFFSEFFSLRQLLFWNINGSRLAEYITSYSNFDPLICPTTRAMLRVQI